MSQPSLPRPVPGPGPAVPGPSRATAEDPAADRFADLEKRPVAEHVEVFEAEHVRLKSELGTIDRL